LFHIVPAQLPQLYVGAKPNFTQNMSRTCRPALKKKV
jgi:hypothetical protein